MNIAVTAAVILNGRSSFGDNYRCLSSEKFNLKTDALTAVKTAFTVLSTRDDSYRVVLNGTRLRSGNAVDQEQTTTTLFCAAKNPHQMAIRQVAYLTNQMNRPRPTDISPFEGEGWRGLCTKSEGSL